jgi:D-alanyl-D-alanine dipeptidase
MSISSNYFTPIGPVKQITGWKKIPIKDNGESLVDIEGLKNSKIIFSKFYYKMGLSGAIDHCLLRETVADKLQRIASRLPHGMKILIYDGWRPIELHTSLYYFLKEKVKHILQNDDEKKIIKYLSTYATPGYVDPLHPSPHFTGGAIDLTLINKNGQELNMGTKFDEMSKTAYTEHFENIKSQHKQLRPLGREILINRRLLYNLMTEESFSNYKFEWWHYDYGDQFWAKTYNTIAQYSLIKKVF